MLGIKFIDVKAGYNYEPGYTLKTDSSYHPNENTLWRAQLPRKLKDVSLKATLAQCRNTVYRCTELACGHRRPPETCTRFFLKGAVTFS